jgi:hypothetical protein
MALASPRSPPQQRVAAAPQLGATTDSSPKGVESATTLSLATECSNVPEQVVEHHHGAETGAAEGTEPTQRVCGQAGASGTGEAAAAPAEDAAAIGRREPMYGGSAAAAGRRHPWARGEDANAANGYHPLGRGGERERLLERLRGHPRPGNPEPRREDAHLDRGDAERHRRLDLHAKRQGSSGPSPQRCGGTDGTGAESCHGQAGLRLNRVSVSRNEISSPRGSACRGGGLPPRRRAERLLGRTRARRRRGQPRGQWRSGQRASAFSCT